MNIPDLTDNPAKMSKVANLLDELRDSNEKDPVSIKIVPIPIRKRLNPDEEIKRYLSEAQI